MNQRDFTLARCEKHQSDYAVDATTHQGMCPDCRRELPPDTAPEYGWVIEGDAFAGQETSYFTGDGWTHDHMKALRFAREQDAMNGVDNITDGHGNAVQHMWLGETIYNMPLPGAPGE